MLADNFYKLTKLPRNAFFLALVIIAGAAIYNWFVVPQTTCLFAAQRYNIVAEKITEKNEIISESINMKKQQLDGMKKQAAQLAGELFASSEAKKFFSDLQAICEETGCQIGSANFNKNERQQQKYELYVKTESAALNVTGTFGSIMQLVEKLQSFKRKVWIDLIDMKIVTNDSHKIKCDLMISIFVLQDEERSLDE